MIHVRCDQLILHGALLQLILLRTVHASLCMIPPKCPTPFALPTVLVICDLRRFHKFPDKFHLNPNLVSSGDIKTCAFNPRKLMALFFLSNKPKAIQCYLRSCPDEPSCFFEYYLRYILLIRHIT